MPIPAVQAALAELQRRGVLPAGDATDGSAPAAPAAPTPDSIQAAPAPAPDQSSTVSSADVTPVRPNAQVPPQLGGTDNPSPRALERNIRVKMMQGQLAIQDAVNELQRRGINVQLQKEPFESATAVN